MNRKGILYDPAGTGKGSEFRLIKGITGAPADKHGIKIFEGIVDTSNPAHNTDTDSSSRDAEDRGPLFRFMKY